MNRDEALRYDRLCELYLRSLEEQHYDALDKLWELAAHDAGLLQAFRELNEGLLEEAKALVQEQEDRVISSLLKQHLPSATTIDPLKLLTVGEVVREMGKQPQSLPGMADLFAKMADSTEPWPEVKGLQALRRWAEARFGSAPEPFWRALHHARLNLNMQQDTTPHYGLAARTAPPPKE